jgi:hypothetical protein
MEESRHDIVGVAGENAIPVLFHMRIVWSSEVEIWKGYEGTRYKAGE